MTLTGLRVAAFGIALIAIMDPALTSGRRSKPLVAVVSDDGNRTMADAVTKVLDRRFAVVRGTGDLAAATVIVGEMPDAWRDIAGPAFGVVRQPLPTDIRITRVETPVAPVGNRVPVDVVLDVTGANGRALEVDLWHGDMLAAQATAPSVVDSGRTIVRMSFVPAGESQRLRAIARIDGAGVADTAFFALHLTEERYDVLFFDARPSWNSTFIRRGLEADPRFSVAHRIQTARGVTNSAGPAPQSLADPATLREFAVIVIGAPGALTAVDVNALESFMRRRGGRVVVLMDSLTNSALNRVTGALSWRATQTTAPGVVVDANARQVFRVRDVVWPIALPQDAVSLASGVGRDSSARPIVWSLPVGAGQLVISGARDAWHYRGDSSGFDAFWRSMIAGLAMEAPSPVEVHVGSSLLRPGEETLVRIVVRDAFLGDLRSRKARVGAALVTAGDSNWIRLWPDGTPGVFVGHVVATREPGTSSLVVNADRYRTEVSIVIDSAGTQPVPDDRAILQSFVSSRGGRVVDEEDLASLPGLIASAVQTVSRVETWHPMRSAWWIIPFALLLGAEWWWRRRNGLN